MKEFIEKLIGRIMLESASCKVYKLINPNKEDIAEFNAYKKCIEIVKELAEEHNGGWIPCSERLPELTEGTEYFKQSPCCLVTLKWWDGDMTESIGWYNQSGVWNDDCERCKVIAWQPLPEPYQPKGE